MADAWGGSWGVSWGVSWGTDAPAPSIPQGGAGYPVGHWWGVRKHKKWTKNLDWILDRVVSEFYGELTEDDMPAAVKKEAAKIVRPYAQDGQKVPQKVNWAKLELDIDRVMQLVELYQKHRDIDDEDETWLMMH